MAVNTYPNILLAGLQANYNALENKDSAKLYFCTDTGKLYKGTVDFTDNLVAVSTKPTTPVVGKIYFIADTNTVEAYVGGAWKVISYSLTTTVDESSDDMHVASAAAVYTAIQAAVENLADSANVVKSVTASDQAAKIVVTTGDNAPTTVTIPEVACRPTWNGSSRTLVFAMSTGENVTVELGKDIFVDPAADNKYNPETKNLEIYLNDATGEHEATKIEIPASGLVDVYTGGSTNSATVSVENNEIKANVKVDADSKNAITVSENGLMVDLSAYATNVNVAAVEAKADKGIADAATAQGAADTANAAIAILNGDDQTTGSVAKQIKDSATAIGTDISNLEARVSDNETNIANLAAATTVWGSF